MEKAGVELLSEPDEAIPLRLAGPSFPVDEAGLGNCLRVALAAIRTKFPQFPPADAEDIVQELALEYLLQRTKVRVPEAWFFVCAARRAQRFLTSRRTAARLPAGLCEAEANRENRFLTRQLVLSLRPECRKLLGRLFIAGFSAREIAAADGCTSRTVYLHAAKCLKCLRSRCLAASR